MFKLYVYYYSNSVNFKKLSRIKSYFSFIKIINITFKNCKIKYKYIRSIFYIMCNFHLITEKNFSIVKRFNSVLIEKNIYIHILFRKKHFYYVLF